jgi:LPXTG-motif cell wall-anchored protein
VTAVQPVVLIPPLVIVPDPPAVVGEGGRSRSLVAPPASGPLLPNTGPTDTGVMALIGLGLIGLGWLVRWSAVR